VAVSDSPPADLERRAPLIGRDSDMERVERLLAPTGALVTIVGAPGVGKTKLASEVLSRSACADRFMVLLADATSERDVLDAIVRATQLQLELGSGELLSQVGHGLAEMGEVLVCLDNVEQIIDPVVHALSVLRAAAPLARWLSTSRERLHAKNDWVLELDPLDVPAEDDDPRASHAVLLLIDRIERASGRALQEADLPHLADIARRLEGIPLALELFSPRIALLGAEAVSDRLKLELEIHAEGPRSLDERQRTLYRAIKTSWEILSEREKDALARFSLFSGGFTVESALAVLPDGAGSSALELLHRLRERSLIRTIDERPLRFAVFQSVRELARELSPASEGEPQLRLAQHLADEVDRAVLAPTGANRRSLLSEHENMRHVAAWASASTDPQARDIGARILLGLELFIDRIPLEPYVADIEAFLGASTVELSADRRVGLRLLAARCKRRLGLVSAALADQKDALLHAQEAKLEPWVARVTSELGMAHFADGDLDAALSHWVTSTEIHGRLHDDGRILVDELRTAMALRERGDLLLAMDKAERAYVRSRRLREPEMGALVLSELSQLRLEFGDWRRASTLLEEAERMPERSLLADAAIVARRGFIEIERGHGELAKQRLQRALFLFHRIGYRRFEGGASGYLGVAELEAGMFQRARTHLEQACDLMRDHVIARGLFAAWLALVELRSGNAERARLIALEAPPLDRQSAYSVATHLLLRAVDPRGATEDLGQVFLAGAGAIAVEASHDVRIALRVLGRVPTSVDHLEAGGMVVRADGSVFELDGERVSIAKHAAMRRILICLVEHRLNQATSSLATETLARAGWPGERIRDDAAKNRVKVAIAGLRKLGLKDTLIHDGTGYALRADLPVEVRAVLPEPAV
jgi:predicted ATPase